MKTVLCSLNSQYVHSSLAPWYLKAAAEEWCRLPQQVTVLEATINQREDAVLERLLEEKADVLAFSCYIWNIEKIAGLLPALAARSPRTRFLLGGPEVSFRPEEVMAALPMVAAVQIGEGERSFAALLDRLAGGETLEGIAGLCYRGETGGLVLTPAEPVREDPPSPYSADYLAALRGRIAYLETSRGCPFSCAFCLSGRREGVRFFEMERAKRELLLLAGAGARTVKLVDRTFNCRADRTYEWIRFILEQRGTGIPPGVCFHLEVAADLFDDRTIELLATAPAGLFQLEAGLQSFHTRTLEAVTRKTDTERLCRHIRRLLEPGNVHVHIDLIAGLPYEDLAVFIDSFNQAYRLRPHMLQLGFLKMLHGSRLRREAGAYGYVYDARPPYEVTGCPWLSGEDLARLHRVEDALERLYNSGRFRFTLEYVLERTGWAPFSLFDGFAAYLHARRAAAGMPLDEYTALALAYFRALPGIEAGRLRDVMACDSLASSGVGRLPPCLHIEDRRLGRIKRRLAAAYGKGVRRGVAILYSLEERAVMAEYDQRDPVTTRYALHWAAPACGGDEAGADPPV